MKQEFSISGMHCTSCKMLIEDELQDMKGIEKCSVDVTAGRMLVEGSFAASDIVRAVEKLGKYKVKVL